MKTSGLREIDFSKTECKNYLCGTNIYPTPRPLKKGETIELKYIKGSGLFDFGYNSVAIVPCLVCKGTGSIDESATTELELE